MHQMVPMRSRFVWAAIVSAVFVFAAVGSCSAREAQAWNFFSTSKTLRVATIPGSDYGATFLTALKQQIALEHARVQLSFIETPSVWASAQALKEKKVDAAVVRSDDPAAAEGRTIFVLRRPSRMQNSRYGRMTRGGVQSRARLLSRDLAHHRSPRLPALEQDCQCSKKCSR
jgi:hypothetical protein